MKQIVQDMKNGGTILEEVPVPQVKAGYVLIKSSRSLVSLGTERMLVEFGKANLIDKARQQPDKVKQVLDKIKTDGLVMGDATMVDSPKQDVVNREVQQEAVAALTMLGFPAAPSQKVVYTILKEEPDAAVEKVIKLALKRL